MEGTHSKIRNSFITTETLHRLARMFLLIEFLLYSALFINLFGSESIKIPSAIAIVVTVVDDTNDE